MFTGLISSERSVYDCSLVYTITPYIILISQHLKTKQFKIRLGPLFGSTCSRTEPIKSRAISCESYLHQPTLTENKRRLYYLSSFFVALALQRPQTTPVVCWHNLSVLKSGFIRVLLILMKHWQPKVVQERTLLSHGLNKSYFTWKIASIDSIENVSSTSIIKKFICSSSDCKR